MLGRDDSKNPYAPRGSDLGLPTDSAARKNIPLARGCLDYFPAALAEVARLSHAGNEKHNPGEELHHARGKSSDHRDCIMRHLAECGVVDTDGFLHDVKVAWRSLANLQETLERLGLAPLARGARLPTETPERTDLVDRLIDERNRALDDIDRLTKVRAEPPPLPVLRCQDIPVFECDVRAPKCEKGGVKCPAAGYGNIDLPTIGLRAFMYGEVKP